MGMNLAAKTRICFNFLLELIYSVVPIFAVWHSDPVIHLYTFFYSYYLLSYSIPRDGI